MGSPLPRGDKGLSKKITIGEMKRIEGRVACEGEGVPKKDKKTQETRESTPLSVQKKFAGWTNIKK